MKVVERYPYKIRWRRVDDLRGQWQFWNGENWHRFGGQAMTPEEARMQASRYLYGVDPEKIIYE